MAGQRGADAAEADTAVPAGRRGPCGPLERAVLRAVERSGGAPLSTVESMVSEEMGPSADHNSIRDAIRVLERCGAVLQSLFGDDEEPLVWPAQAALGGAASPSLEAARAQVAKTPVPARAALLSKLSKSHRGRTTGWIFHNTLRFQETDPLSFCAALVPLVWLRTLDGAPLRACEALELNSADRRAVIVAVTEEGLAAVRRTVAHPLLTPAPGDAVATLSAVVQPSKRRSLREVVGLVTAYLLRQAEAGAAEASAPLSEVLQHLQWHRQEDGSVRAITETEPRLLRLTRDGPSQPLVVSCEPPLVRATPLGSLRMRAGAGPGAAGARHEGGPVSADKVAAARLGRGSPRCVHCLIVAEGVTSADGEVTGDDLRALLPAPLRPRVAVAEVGVGAEGDTRNVLVMEDEVAARDALAYLQGEGGPAGVAVSTCRTAPVPGPVLKQLQRRLDAHWKRAVLRATAAEGGEGKGRSNPWRAGPPPGLVQGDGEEEAEKEEEEEAEKQVEQEQGTNADAANGDSTDTGGEGDDATAPLAAPEQPAAVRPPAHDGAASEGWAGAGAGADGVSASQGDSSSLGSASSLRHRPSSAVQVGVGVGARPPASASPGEEGRRAGDATPWTAGTPPWVWAAGIETQGPRPYDEVPGWHATPGIPTRAEAGTATTRLDVQLRRDLEPLTRRVPDLVRAVAARAGVEQADAMVAVAALGLADKAARRATVAKCVAWLEGAEGDASGL